MNESDTEQLIENLRALAREMETTEQAPPHVEASLRTAFRHHREQHSWRRRMATGAIAASVALLVASAVVILRQPPAPPAAKALPVQPAETEITTGFLPVIGGDFAEPLDRGRLVRIQLPRSALRSFGIPMNEDRFWEPVTADVVLGEDGLARAIRFVQTSSIERTKR